MEVYRVRVGRKPSGYMEIGGYEILAQAKDQDKAFAGKLATILFDEKTYNFEVAKGCEFDPGVAFRVWKDKASAIVLLCFACDELEIQQDKHRGHEDFDAKRGELLKLAKLALPDDKDIQALEEKQK